MEYTHGIQSTLSTIAGFHHPHGGKYTLSSHKGKYATSPCNKEKFQLSIIAPGQKLMFWSMGFLIPWVALNNLTGF